MSWEKTLKTQRRDADGGQPKFNRFGWRQERIGGEKTKVAWTKSAINFYDAMGNFEKIRVETENARRRGEFQTEEQVRPLVTKQIEAMKAIQGTIGQYIQVMEDAL